MKIEFDFDDSLSSDVIDKIVEYFSGFSCESWQVIPGYYMFEITIETIGDFYDLISGCEKINNKPIVFLTKILTKNKEDDENVLYVTIAQDILKL